MIRNVKVMLLTLAAISAAGCAHSDRTVPTMGWPQWKLADSQSGERAPVLAPPKILPETHFAAACLHEQQGMIGEAIGQYRKAIALNHNYVKAYHRLGVLLSRTGQLTEATEMLRQAVLLKRDDPVLYNNLGYTLMLQGKWEQARGEFNRAVALEPHFARARINLGLTLGKLGRFDEALGHFKAVLPAGDAYYNLGLVYNGQRRYQKAADAFEHVLSIDPDFAAAGVQLDKLAPYVQPPPAKVAAKRPGGDAKKPQGKVAPSKPARSRVTGTRHQQKAQPAPTQKAGRFAKAGSKTQRAHKPHPVKRQNRAVTPKPQPARKQQVGKAPDPSKVGSQAARKHKRMATAERKPQPVKRQNRAVKPKPQPVRKRQVGEAPAIPKAEPQASRKHKRMAKVGQRPQPVHERKTTPKRKPQPVRRKSVNTKASTVVETPKPETATKETPKTQALRQKDGVLRQEEPAGQAFEDIAFFEPPQPSAPISAAITEDLGAGEALPRVDEIAPLWEEEFDEFGNPCPKDAFDAPQDDFTDERADHAAAAHPVSPTFTPGEQYSEADVADTLWEEEFDEFGNPCPKDAFDTPLDYLAFGDAGLAFEEEPVEWEAAYSELAEMLRPAFEEESPRLAVHGNRPPITLAAPTGPDLAGPPMPEKLATIRRVGSPVREVREPARSDRLVEIEARLAAVREEINCWRETVAKLEEKSYLNFSFADATTIDDVMRLIDLEELAEIASVPELIERSQRRTMAATVIPTGNVKVGGTDTNTPAPKTRKTTAKRQAGKMHSPSAPRATKPKPTAQPPAKVKTKKSSDAPPQRRKYHLGRKDPPKPIEPVRAF